MLIEFIIPILYTQVLVNDLSHPSPGLNWNDNHVAQGFAWAPGVVSFGIPDHDGEVMIRVHVADAPVVDDETLWAVEVPYEVKEPLEIGTVGLMMPLEVPVGSYRLVFEARAGLTETGTAYLLNLTFVASEAPGFAILRQGGELTTARVLTTEADLSVPIP